jgi:ubiquinone/menaquinone biosynthesis C-methylase UbiE
MKIEFWSPPENGNKFETAVEKHNAIASEYEEQYNTLYWKIYDDITWHHMSEEILPNAKGKLLDAGGGTGKWARKFAKNGFQVEVFDLAENMIAMGKKYIKEENLLDKVHFRKGDVCEIPFDDEEFNAVICQGNPLSYCSDPYKAIKELARVAKRDAPIVMSVHNKLAMIHYFCFFMGKITINQALELSETSKVMIDYPIKAFTPDELRLVCEANGLKVNNIIGKHTVTGYIQSESYLSILAKEEGYKKALELEKKYYKDPSVLGLAGHLQISCTKR